LVCLCANVGRESTLGLSSSCTTDQASWCHLIFTSAAAAAAATAAVVCFPVTLMHFSSVYFLHIVSAGSVDVFLLLLLLLCCCCCFSCWVELPYLLPVSSSSSSSSSYHVSFGFPFSDLVNWVCLFSRFRWVFLRKRH
jgi:hypothetical protein